MSVLALSPVERATAVAEVSDLIRSLWNDDVFDNEIRHFRTLVVRRASHSTRSWFVLKTYSAKRKRVCYARRVVSSPHESYVFHWTVSLSQFPVNANSSDLLICARHANGKRSVATLLPQKKFDFRRFSTDNNFFVDAQNFPPLGTFLVALVIFPALSVFRCADICVWVYDT